VIFVFGHDLLREGVCSCRSWIVRMVMRMPSRGVRYAALHVTDGAAAVFIVSSWTWNRFDIETLNVVFAVRCR